MNRGADVNSSDYRGYHMDLRSSDTSYLGLWFCVDTDVDSLATWKSVFELKRVEVTLT